KDYSFDLPPRGEATITVEASCINAALPIPRNRHRFTGVKRVPDDLARFLRATQHESAMTVQAGVWALTDGYSANDVQARLRIPGGGGRTRSAVTDEDIRNARRILDQLNIDHGL